MTKGMGDLGVGVGTVSSAVDDAAADLRDGVAGEGERGRRDSLPEGEFDGPAAALLDGLRGGGRRERRPRGTAAAAAGVSVAATAAAGVGLAAERGKVPPPFPAVPDGLHVGAAAAAAA
jgi:hypothetical protein